MCNDYGIDIPFRLFVEAFSDLRIPLDFSGGAPNLEPREEIWPTERAPVIAAAPAGGRLEMMRWGLSPGRPKGAPVINMRGEGREFSKGRCLVPASHFYEFTGSGSPKTRWRFTKAGAGWFCIAGLVGAGMSDGQSVPAFTMLTVPAGPDVAPLHDRQIVILERRDWAAWLDCQTPAQALLRPSAAGVLSVAAAPRAARPAGLFEGPAPASRPVQN
jgi:putative SOS response-associated peptidase YedK